MRRLLLLVAAVCAFAALAAVAAKGATPSVTLATPAVTVVDDTMMVTGALSGTEVLGDVDVTLYAYETAAQCAANDAPYTVDEWSTGADGTFSFAVGSETPGTWWLAAEVYVGEEPVLSGCVEATFAEVVAPPKPTSSFLCWNREMTNPVVYTDPLADEMWATGKYFEPQAILGNVEGGTNIGAYHLVCNAPATMKATGEGLGGSGEVYSAATMTLYHQQHLGGNDLNLYHIYK